MITFEISSISENLYLSTSIYFEEFAIDYLLNKGIEKEEISFFHRFKDTKKCCESLYQYEIILLAYHDFGNIDENTNIEEMQQNIEVKIYAKQVQ